MPNALRKKIVEDYLEGLLGYNQAQLYADGYEAFHPRVIEFLGLKSRKPRPTTFTFITKRLIDLYNKYEKLKTKSLQTATIRSHFSERLREMRLDDLFRFGEAGLYVEDHILRELYQRARDEREVVADALEPDRTTGQDGAKTVIKFKIDIAEANLLEVIQRFTDLFNVINPEFAELCFERQREFVLRMLLNLQEKNEGCTTVTTIMPLDIARQLEKAFKDGLLPDIGGLTVIPCGHTVEPDVPREELEWLVVRKWRSASRRESLIRPWVRLRWLFSPSVASSPLAHAISESDLRAYASKVILQKFRSLRNDLFVSWLLWPTLTTVLLISTLIPLKLFLPDLNIACGIAAGILLSVSGGQICAAVVAPIAAGAGGICMGWAFGVALAAAIGRFGATGVLAATEIQQHVALAVIGGPLGLTAPFWRGNFQPASIVAMLMAIALSITVAGYLMAQPKRADPVTAARRLAGDKDASNPALAEAQTKGSTIAGGLLGAMMGAGIGVTFGATALLMALGLSPLWSFMGGFGLVGGAAFGVLVWRVQHRSQRESALFAAVFVTLASCAVYLAATAGGLAGIMFLTIANAIFHALWFTAAHVAGALFSPRAAVIATTLEGAVGFTAFLAAQILLT